jgi:hypothetical protein
MSAHELTPPATIPASRLITVTLLALTLAYVVILGGAVWHGQWLVDAQGRPIASDFVNVWAAGKLTADGHPALAYDWSVHKSMEVRAVGHAFANYYGWHYPPPFLAVAALLATVTILPATFAWLSLTAAACAVTLRAILTDRAGILLALGFPASLWTVTAGQNGFLTTALIGGTLTLIERQPVAAGICLGLLTYKPHFGLLFPVALIAARQWRVLVAASITALAMIAVSWLAYGTETWMAFFAATPKMTQAVLGQGLAEFGRMQSVFGLVRAHGGGATLAWAAQASVSLLCVVSIFALWRSRAAFALKAAALATAALLATPYLYIYDLVVLTIPVAYLLRLGLAQGSKPGFTRSEIVGLPLVGALLLSYPLLKTQVGLGAVVIIAALVARRAAADHLASVTGTAVPSC